MSPNTLCACDENSEIVSVVKVTDNTVNTTLIKPTWVRDETPYKLEVTGNTILVMFSFQLVVYENGVSSPGTMLDWPAGLRWFSAVSSDGVSSFLVCDTDSKAVLVLGVSGTLCDEINIVTVSNVEGWGVGMETLLSCHHGDTATTTTA